MPGPSGRCEGLGSSKRSIGASCYYLRAGWGVLLRSKAKLLMPQRGKTGEPPGAFLELSSSYHQKTDDLTL